LRESASLDPGANSAGNVRIAGLDGSWRAIDFCLGGITRETLRIDLRLPPQ